MSSASSLSALLRLENLDGLLVSSVPAIIYLTGFGGFSLEERESFLIITSNGKYLFSDARYTEGVKQKVRYFDVIEISSTYPMKQALKDIVLKQKIKALGFESADLSVEEYTQLKKILKITFKPADTLIRRQRMKKTKLEISAIEKACRLGDEAFVYILKKIKPGVSEIELAAELDYFIKKRGGDLSFKSNVSFGQHTAIPHHQPTDEKLKKRDIILFDFGVKLNNYCSDMTRTVFLGKAQKEQKKVYQTVLKAQKKAIDAISQGIKLQTLDSVARNYIGSKSYPSIPHSLGHGIGVEVHESPFISPNSSETLRNGMVFSVEPGIYFPGKFGVRIEDIVAFGDSKAKLLTIAPREMTEL